MRITGKTRIIFILGDPVAHIVGTDVLNRAFAERGLDMAVSPLQIAPADLDHTFAMLRRIKNVAGFGITIPHKIAAVGLVDELTHAARDIGAVNFVRRNADGSLTGHNVDGAGFMAGLKQHGFSGREAKVLMVGAGGVGRAIGFAVARAGASRLAIANRTPRAAIELGAAIAAAVPGLVPQTYAADALPPLGAFDLVINATALGMEPGDPMPFAPSGLSAEATVAEVVMSPAMTKVLLAAQAKGCRIVPGGAMMAGQPALVADFLGL